jgi:serine/threonine protein phosphatase PrpC
MLLPGHSSSGSNGLLEGSNHDPRLDFSHLEDTGVREFTCPKCGRVFQDWQSCHLHANSRRHAKFCTYDRRNLPTCINTHSMLPAHPTSGYCDLQGRRRTIEDFHSIHLHASVQFYGIFDGHTGNLASKYVASKLYEQLVMRLPDLHTYTTEEVNTPTQDWKVEVQQNISQAFREIHEGFLEAVSLSSSPSHMDQSGTTATALLVTDEVIIVSSLGDSRAVLSSTNTDGTVSAIQLTKDHVASDPAERKLVLERGGSTSSSGGTGTNSIARVNGTLAITRSIGDANLAPLLSREPHVVSWTRGEIRKQCGTPCFVVLASDGLWDVMSNQEAVDMVVQVMESYDATDSVSWNNGGAFQEAAEILAIDAYVRGSTDNIGVCVVAVD